MVIVKVPKSNHKNNNQQNELYPNEIPTTDCSNKSRLQ